MYKPRTWHFSCTVMQHNEVERKKDFLMWWEMLGKLVPVLHWRVIWLQWVKLSVGVLAFTKLWSYNIRDFILLFLQIGNCNKWIWELVSSTTSQVCTCLEWGTGLGISVHCFMFTTIANWSNMLTCTLTCCLKMLWNVNGPKFTNLREKSVKWRSSKFSLHDMHVFFSIIWHRVEKLTCRNTHLHTGC